LVSFGHHYAHAHDTRRSLTKAEICAELGATILVDDSLIYANQCAQTLHHVRIREESVNIINIISISSNSWDGREWELAREPFRMKIVMLICSS
jgi:hypothetical protein